MESYLLISARFAVAVGFQSEQTAVPDKAFFFFLLTIESAPWKHKTQQIKPHWQSNSKESSGQWQ